MNETKIYIAKNGDRLDKIVYEHYKSLDHFSEVLALNSKLSSILKTGDKVILPFFEPKESKDNALW